MVLNTKALEDCAGGKHVPGEPDDKTGIALCIHCRQADFVHQPRENPVRCSGCGKPTWNISTVCDACKLHPITR